MGNELELKEMLNFIYSYNVNSNRNNIFLNQTVIAENYLKRLKTLDKNGYEKIIKDIENKLKIIINKNTERISKSNNSSKNSSLPDERFTPEKTEIKSCCNCGLSKCSCFNTSGLPAKVDKNPKYAVAPVFV